MTSPSCPQLGALNKYTITVTLLSLRFGTKAFATNKSTGNISEFTEDITLFKGLFQQLILIDTFKGDIWILTSNTEKKHSWSKMTISGTRPSYTKPTYQLFPSGIMRSTNIMVNTKTGNTFEFLEDKEIEVFLSELK